VVVEDDDGLRPAKKLLHRLLVEGEVEDGHVRAVHGVRQALALAVPDADVLAVGAAHVPRDQGRCESVGAPAVEQHEVDVLRAVRLSRDGRRGAQRVLLPIEDADAG
jgi:hypothetical protein